MAYSVFKDFYKKNIILRATLYPQMAINFERNHLKAWKYILKVKKFWECVKLRLESVEQNIEGDANLHPPTRNRVKHIKQWSMQFCLVRASVTKIGIHIIRIWIKFYKTTIIWLILPQNLTRNLIKYFLVKRKYHVHTFFQQLLHNSIKWN